MKISAVVPSYNSGEALRLCLLSLTHQRLGAQDDLEVVVVDDGSSDDTRAVVEGFTSALNLTYVFKPRTEASGRSAARNTGIGRAAGELIMMIDADHVFPPDFIAEHVRYHEIRPDLVVLGPRGVLGEGIVDVDRLEREFSFSYLPPIVSTEDSRAPLLARLSENFNNLATGWHHTFTCNVSVRRAHLLAVGGFDEKFTGWGLEDSELGYRLRRRGLAFAFNPKAALYTWQGPGVNHRMYGEWRRNLDYFMAKHPGLEVALQTVLDEAYNPDVQDVDWMDSYLRFEYAVRALHGRFPATGSFDVLEIDDDNAPDLLAALPLRAKAGNLIVIDDTADAAAAPVVQCQDSPHELLYFHRPEPTRRARIRTHGAT